MDDFFAGFIAGFVVAAVVEFVLLILYMFFANHLSLQELVIAVAIPVFLGVFFGWLNWFSIPIKF